MVSKENLGRGSKQTKKANLTNERQKKPSNKEQTSVLSKRKKGRKGKATPATDLRVDESWPPKPWIKKLRKGRKGKIQCYANPKTGQEYYSEFALKRHLAHLADNEAKEAAKRLQEKDTASDGVVLEITVDSTGVEDLDYFFREVESREASGACVPDDTQMDFYSDFSMWDVESFMAAQAPAIADGNSGGGSDIKET